MRKCTIPMMLLFLVLYGLHLTAHDAYALDAPHNATNDITCNSSCHLTASQTASWQSQTNGPIDATFYNNMCWSCHNEANIPDSAGRVLTHSSFQTSNTYGDWVMECRTCHNPHNQVQVTTYPSSTLNTHVTGTLTAVATTYVKVSTALTPSYYIGYILVPDAVNKSNSTFYYQIIGNTADTVYVDSRNPIYTYGIKKGATFAIRYNGLVKNAIVTPQNGINTMGTMTVRFFAKTGSNSFASSATTIDGVCQVCHSQTKYFTNDGSAFDVAVNGDKHPTTGGTDCTGCHSHSSGFKASCNACHGNPPVVDTPGGAVNGLVLTNGTNTTGSLHAGAHAVHVTSHNVVCSSCHDNNVGGSGPGSNHNNTGLTINVGFSLASQKGGLYDGQTTANYAASNGVTTVTKAGNMTCSNIYCHSTAQGATGTAMVAGDYKQKVWTDTTALNCGSCHKNMNDDGTAPGSHPRHVQSQGYACATCHNGYTATSVGSTHVDGQINLGFSGNAAGASYSKTSTFNPAMGYGTCATSNCHGSLSPTWGNNTNSAQCVKCHGVKVASPGEYTADPKLAAPGYISTSPLGTGVNTAGNTGTYSNGVSNDPKVGAHNAHLLGSGAYKPGGIACNDCHSVTSLSDPGHMNGSTTFSWSSLATSGGTLTPSYSNGVCSNVYCHGAAFVNTQGTGTMPGWTDATYLANPASVMNTTDCNKCHQSPAYSSKFDHAGISVGAGNCGACHQHNGSGATHIDGILQAAGGNCNSCHDYDVDVVTGDWGKNEKAIEGWGAHAAHINHLKVLSGVTLSASVDSFGSTAFNAVCGVCHTRDSALHSMGGTTNVRSINFGDGLTAYAFTSSGTPTYLGITGTSSASKPKTCSNVSCHYQTSPVWEGI